MNKKYIKRQLTLNKIGIPMSESIDECYTAFKSIFDKEKLIFDNIHMPEHSCYKRTPGDIVILSYDINKCIFYVLITIWEDFAYAINVKESAKTVDLVLMCFLEHEFNVEVKDINVF